MFLCVTSTPFCFVLNFANTGGVIKNKVVSYLLGISDVLGEQSKCGILMI